LTTKERLLAEYDRLEDAIEAASVDQTWTLADWLADKVPAAQPGPRSETRGADLTTADLAERRGRSKQWLNRIRKVAAATRGDRVEAVSVRAYEEALIKANWDLAKANAALLRKGSRLRDQAGPMESVAAIQEQLAKRTPAERAQIVGATAGDSEVMSAMAPEALNRIDIAAATETHLRKRGKVQHEPPLDAASRLLGGQGPGAASKQLFNESMEPLIGRVYFALQNAKTQWQRFGFRLALTDLGQEMDEMDEMVHNIGVLYAEMHDEYDAAKAAKVANQVQGERL
jgi:hypothetical protein